MKSAYVVFLLLLLACGRAAANTSGDCVVLLHGLARTSSSMEAMGEALAAAGFQVVNVDYPSRDFPIEELSPLAVEDGIFLCGEAAQVRKVHFVTHSLGGILVRYYFEHNSSERVGRVVMLGPPNQGSAAADRMSEWPGFDWLNGPAGAQLGQGPDSVPLSLGVPDFEFAVIAGNRTIDPITSAVLEDPDDGKVSVVDTRLDGMADFQVIAVSHAYIMQDEEVIELTERFLRTGSFSQ